MTKYQPGDKVTVKAIVRHNCLCPDLLGVVIGDIENSRQTIVVNVDEIVSHEAPLRVGDNVKLNNGETPHTFEVLGISGKYAWVTRDQIPFTIELRKLERV